MIHLVVDICANTQVAAVVHDVSKTFVESDANRGAHMLFAAGLDLQDMLVDGGLLQNTKCLDGAQRLCTCTARVRATFAHLCYVIVSKESKFYKNCRHGPICTCKWFCRYSGCEHVDFTRFLNLRLLPAGPDDIPSMIATHRKRGRPLGMKKVAGKPKHPRKRNKEQKKRQRKESAPQKTITKRRRSR